MPLALPNHGWLRQLPQQGTFVTAPTLVEAYAYVTEPIDAFRALLSSAVDRRGALFEPSRLLFDPAGLHWDADHWLALTAVRVVRLLADAPKTPELGYLGVLYEGEIDAAGVEQRGALHPPDAPTKAVLLAVVAGEDLDAGVSEAGSPTQQAERLGRALSIPIVVLLGQREIRLVYAPPNAPSGWLSFPVDQLLAEDNPLLGALHMLIGERRLLSLPEEKRLGALLEASRQTRVRSLTLDNVGVFSHAELALCPGINVLIGQNGSGKTHAMKALYALLWAMNDGGPDESTLDHLALRAKRKLAAVLRPDGDELGRLVRWGSSEARIAVQVERGASATYTFGLGAGTSLQSDGLWNGPESIMYLPTRELLAFYEGFLPAYQTAQLAFDETLYDACLALQRPLLRSVPEAAAGILMRLQKIAGGQVVLKGNRFYIQRGERLVEAQLLAEGIRKLAAVAQLVANGSVAPFGVLIWDEPEGNLNPVLIVEVADMLIDLAALGVQVVVASHDYLFVRRLSLLSEYKKRPEVPIRFFGLCPTDQGVIVETGDKLADLAHNSILDEFTRQGEFEQALFYET